MKKCVASLFVLAITVLGAGSAARACYYQAISIWDCSVTYAQVCSTNADGTGTLYYTGRMVLVPFYLCG